MRLFLMQYHVGTATTFTYYYHVRFGSNNNIQEMVSSQPVFSKKWNDFDLSGS